MPKTAPVKNTALAIWLILIGKAENRQILTYKLLGQMLRPPLGQRNLTWHLARVMAYCHDKHLPNLTTLVVAQKTGLPGPGLDIVNNKSVEPNKRGEAFARERERVFQTTWYQLRPPTPDELERAWTKHKDHF